MGPYKTSSPLLSLPSAANGVTVTPPGVSYGWSSWVELTASSAANMRLAAILALPGVRVVGNYYEVEVGVGGMGSEAPVAAARGISGFNAGNPADLSDVLHVAIPADVIHAGDRVSVRLRQASTATTAWRVSIQYWALPVTGTMPASTVGPVNVPAGSSLVPVTGSGNTYGAWVEVTAAADGDWTITNVSCIGANHATWEVEFGTGAPGFETPIWSVRSYGEWFNFANAWQGGPWNILLRPPLGPIASGTRLAIRVRSDAGSFGLGIGLTVVKQAVTGVASNLRMLWTDWIGLTSVAGGLGNFTAWTEFIPSTATAIAVSGMAKTYPQAGLTGSNIVQLGVGPIGSEVLFAEFYVLNGIWGGGRFNYPLPYARLLPAGSRMSLRFSSEYLAGGAGTSFTVSYQEVLTTPDFDNWTSTLIQQAYLNPVGAPYLPFHLVCGTPAWNNGAWVQVDASTPAARVITAYITGNPAQIEYEIDFGVGVSGHEIPVTTLRMASGAAVSDGATMHDVLPIPAIIPVTSRFSVRARGSIGGATVDLVPHYTAEPADGPDITSLSHDCQSGAFTIVGTNLLDNNAELSSVEHNGNAVAFTVLAQSNTEITFELVSLFANGTYCVVVSSDAGDTDPFCGLFKCSPPIPGTTVFTVRRLRQSPHTFGEGQRLYHKRLQIDLQAGIGTGTAITTAEPRLLLQFSDDGGATWTHEREMEVGAVGQYGLRVQAYRLGEARDRVYRLIVTDPVLPWSIVDAYVDIESGIS